MLTVKQQPSGLPPVKRHVAGFRAASGFTIIELVIVIVLLGLLGAVAVPHFVDLSAEAERASVQAQAAALISNDTLNVAACRTGNSSCVDITSTGDSACIQGVQTFMPQLDLGTYTISNIPSNIPPDDWSGYIGDSQAIFWVTRFLLTEPGESWLAAGWNVRQPCILGRNN
jgi:prepilin-type N-terminal cleavage/methylation domain-containing protein